MNEITDFSRPGILSAVVTKLNPKFVTEGDFEGYNWTVEFSSEIDPECVNSLEGTIPSAMKYHSKAISEKSYASILVKPLDSIVFIEFQSAVTREAYFKSMATIVSLKLNVNDKFQTFVGKVKIDHLDLEQSSALLYCLGRELILKAEPRQQTLYDIIPEPEVRVGQIVCAKTDSSILYGRVASVSGFDIEIEDFGKTFSINRPTAVLDIEISQVVYIYYQKACQDLNVKPSWGYLVSGLAAAPDTGDGLVITQSVVDATMQIQSGDTHG
jgi:hypothetical protein